MRRFWVFVFLVCASARLPAQTFNLQTDREPVASLDGVVEATNEHRELFGFDRTQAISHQSASAIAEAAKQFGQHDDISVLSATLAPALKGALA